ncbi:hypothetical protein [Nocardia aurantiaca]|uniref:Uncharacterized protein n=1 Tax=Nocardia aurantiaca TaxID=2675850 RepID=A0A6I3L8M7_9NOCA|nr:hypothetical protein [Nocardia aurantiaca]MTE16785.1 hypothetical protein [Nocardia aurantiaca]
MGSTTGDPRERADLDDDGREPDFASEHETVTTDPDPNGETESPRGLGGMDPESGGVV